MKPSWWTKVSIGEIGFSKNVGPWDEADLAQGRGPNETAGQALAQTHAS